MFSCYIKNLICMTGAQSLPLKEGEIWSLETDLFVTERAELGVAHLDGGSWWSTPNSA